MVALQSHAPVSDGTSRLTVATAGYNARASGRRRVTKETPMTLAPPQRLHHAAEMVKDGKLVPYRD